MLGSRAREQGADRRGQPRGDREMTFPAIDEQVTFIYTTDLERSADFYERVLRLRLALDQGGCRIYHVAGGAYIGVCQRAAGDIQPPSLDKHSVILTLVTEEVDAWYERLAGHGVAFEARPRLNAEYGIYHVFLRDPNGYLLEIQRFENRHWRKQARP
jgi:catechol 2,3-dioxygenase-like lactoylglutathione lyase family enzyme